MRREASEFSLLFQVEEFCNCYFRMREAAELLTVVRQKLELKVGIWESEELRQDVRLGKGQLTVEEANEVGQS